MVSSGQKFINILLGTKIMIIKLNLCALCFRRQVLLKVIIMVKLNRWAFWLKMMISWTNIIFGIKLVMILKKKLSVMWLHRFIVDKYLKQQLFTKCLRLTPVFMWNNTLRENVFNSILLVSRKFLIWKEDWTLGYRSIKFWTFSDIYNLSKILNLTLFGNLRGNLYIPCLLLITVLRFHCGNRKTW